MAYSVCMSIFMTIGQTEQELQLQKIAGGGEKEKEPKILKNLKSYIISRCESRSFRGGGDFQKKNLNFFSNFFLGRPN